MFGKKKSPAQGGPAEQSVEAESNEEGGESGVMGSLAAWGNSAMQSVLGFVKDPKETIYQARLDTDGRQEEVLGDAHEVSNQDVILEQLAHQGAYGRLDNTKLAAWGYREAGAHQDPESGFRAVLFVPTEEAKAGETPQAKIIRAIHGGPVPAVLAFRGTAEKRGVEDDMNRHGVGTYQFSSNESFVEGMMGEAGGKVIVTGHSLGGALAQLAATHFPGNVSRVVTFQAPAVSEDETDKLKAHNAAASPEDQVTSTHHRAEGDLVHTAGEQLTEGDVFTYGSVGVGNPMDHTSFPLARLAAARGDMIPGINDEAIGKKGGDRLVDVEKTTTKEEKSGLMPKLTEGARKTLGAPMRDEGMESYVSMWNDVKDMHKTGSFSKGYIEGVVKDSPRLNDLQKIKMRDQVAALYPDDVA